MSRDADALRREALRILAETRRDHPRHKHALDRITIRISRRLTRSAGNADPRTGVVQLSEPIFRLEENAHGYRNTVLHEIAHHVTHHDPIGRSEAAHGATFCGHLIALHERVIGPESALMLRAAFDAALIPIASVEPA